MQAHERVLTGRNFGALLREETRGPEHPKKPAEEEGMQDQNYSSACSLRQSTSQRATPWKDLGLHASHLGIPRLPEQKLLNTEGGDAP